MFVIIILPANVHLNLFIFYIALLYNSPIFILYIIYLKSSAVKQIIDFLKILVIIKKFIVLYILIALTNKITIIIQVRLLY